VVPTPNGRDDVHVTAGDLLAVSKTPGTITEAGLRNNISVALQYLASWLGGSGAVGIFNLMEDAATAEISRSQVWQWVQAGVKLDDTGDTVTADLVRGVADDEHDGVPAGHREDVALLVVLHEADQLLELVEGEVGLELVVVGRPTRGLLALALELLGLILGLVRKTHRLLLIRHPLGGGCSPVEGSRAGIDAVGA